MLVASLRICNALERHDALAGQRSRQASIVERRVLAIVAKPIWIRKLPVEIFGNALPLMSDASQVIVDTGMRLRSYSVRDGSLRWQSRAGLHSPLTVVGDNIFCIDIAANRIEQLDRTTGAIVWSSDRIKTPFSDTCPEQPCLLVDARTVALVSGHLIIADRKSGRVIVAASNEGTIFFGSLKQIGSNLLVHQSFDGARTVESITAYDSRDGHQVWESGDDASDVWVHERTAIVKDILATPPFFTYAPVTLEYQPLAEGIAGPGAMQAMYAPDVPLHIEPAYTRPVVPVYVSWPNVWILMNSKLYRYDARQTPDFQTPDRVNAIGEVLGMLDNDTLVSALQDSLRFIGFRDRNVRMAYVKRRVRSDTSAPPQLLALGLSAAALSDASGTLLIGHGGNDVADISSSCKTLISAAAVNSNSIAVVCADKSQAKLKLFGYP